MEYDHLVSTWQRAFEESLRSYQDKTAIRVEIDFYFSIKLLDLRTSANMHALRYWLRLNLIATIIEIWRN